MLVKLIIKIINHIKISKDSKSYLLIAINSLRHRVGFLLAVFIIEEKGMENYKCNNYYKYICVLWLWWVVNIQVVWIKENNDIQSFLYTSIHT